MDAISWRFSSLNALEMPPGSPQTGWVALPPRISVIFWPYARCLMTSLATGMPAFSMTPRMFRFSGGASGPTMKSGPPR